MKIKKRLSLWLVAVMAFVLLIPGALAVSFGVSPPWIVNENLKPGSNFVYVINLSTNEPSRDMLVHTEITGDPEVAQWLKIRDQENLVMPQGEKLFPLYVEVNVPQEAPLGKYEGDVSVTITPKDKEEEGEIAIRLGGHIAAQLDVIDYDVTDYWVKSVNLEPILAGKSSLNLNVTIKNLGNTTLSEIETNLDVLNHETKELVAQASGGKLSAPVYPHTMEERTLSVPIPDLKAGKYWVDVNVLKDGQVSYQNQLYLDVEGKVTSEEELKAAAEPGSATISTAVRVKAPLSDRLMSVIIALLVVLIALAVGHRMNHRKR